VFSQQMSMDSWLAGLGVQFRYTS